MIEPLAVLVNGLPGAGKTTLARALSRYLGLALFSKDVIKEAHADVLGDERPDGPQRRVPLERGARRGGEWDHVGTAGRRARRWPSWSPAGRPMSAASSRGLEPADPVWWKSGATFRWRPPGAASRLATRATRSMVTCSRMTSGTAGDAPRGPFGSGPPSTSTPPAPSTSKRSPPGSDRTAPMIRPSPGRPVPRLLAIPLRPLERNGHASGASRSVTA
ncbi:AAA family ATPase [Spirillospora sp. NPDC047279]|uniref:AAA family ATPase n=1 Tax=Spirillospora sp. NPDC047279 TaxID=3155478 RepID=UPI0033D8E02E